MGRKKISRREFGLRASAVAVTSVAGAAVLPVEVDAHASRAGVEDDKEKFGLTAAQREEVEAKLANIVRKFGDRLTQEQRTHLRKILSFNERMLTSVRAFPLQNGDAPASVLRISPLEEISTNKTSLRNFANHEFGEGKD